MLSVSAALLLAATPTLLLAVTVASPVRPARLPTNPPPSLASDTRVNSLLLQSARRGGLFRPEPEAELLLPGPAGVLRTVQVNLVFPSILISRFSNANTFL